MKKTIALTLVTLSLILILSACGGKVVINTNGGSLDSTYVEHADFEDIISSIPEREGYVFAGWYSDAAFTDYINPSAITEKQKDANRAFAKWITVPESCTYGVRKDETTVTDSGRAYQKLDEVVISKDYNVTDLVRAGYTSLEVTVKYSACEVNDGNQFVMLYKDENCKKPATSSLVGIIDKYVTGEDEEDPSLLYKHRFEHSGAANPEWKDYEFETTVSLSAIEDKLYIRYGASGEGEDTWKNKDIVVIVKPVK